MLCIVSFLSTKEDFQEVFATGDVAKKCGDNLFPIHRSTDRKMATLCDSDNLLLISTKRHVFALFFFFDNDVVTKTVHLQFLARMRALIPR